MSTPRFTPEFKDEAVKQVVERGYSVAEVAARLGMSTHSFFKWVDCRGLVWPQANLSGGLPLKAGVMLMELSPETV